MIPSQPQSHRSHRSVSPVPSSRSPYSFLPTSCQHTYSSPHTTHPNPQNMRTIGYPTPPDPYTMPGDPSHYLETTYQPALHSDQQHITSYLHSQPPTASTYPPIVSHQSPMSIGTDGGHFYPSQGGKCFITLSKCVYIHDTTNYALFVFLTEYIL